METSFTGDNLENVELLPSGRFLELEYNAYIDPYRDSLDTFQTSQHT